MTAAAVVDKHGKLASIPSSARVELELGCGQFRKHLHTLTIDAIDSDAVDIVGDIFDVLTKIPASSVDAVYSSHFVEHLDDLERFVLELGRVLKVGGEVTTIAPHFSNPYFYSDYTHRRSFGLYTFSYLADDRLLYRGVPRYVKDTGFELVRVRLIFKAPRPFYLGWLTGRMMQAVVNLGALMQEWYERRLCYAFPCYEVEYRIVKRR